MKPAPKHFRSSGRAPDFVGPPLELDENAKFLLNRQPGGFAPRGAFAAKDFFGDFAGLRVHGWASLNCFQRSSNW